MSKLKTKCIEYRGTLLDGYGILHLPKSKTTYKAHRLAWILYRGKIPKNLYICHKCDNRACINIDHLFLGTHTDNMKDMIKKGRGIQPDNAGSKHGMAKLTEEQVKDIKVYLKIGLKNLYIAHMYNVSRQTVTDIKLGRGWKHI